MAVQMPRSVVAALLTIVLCLQQLRSGNGEGSGEGTILPGSCYYCVLFNKVLA